MDLRRIEALRPEVEKTPEGSLARQLLEIIDADLEQTRKEARQRLVNIIRAEDRTDEQAEAIVQAIEKGYQIEHETVQCWVCRGTGKEEKTACMGVNFETCSKCYGSGTAHRVKMPPPEEGDEG